MSTTEVLKLLVTANGQQAITELGKIGNAAKRDLGGAERSIDQLSNKMIGFGAASIAGGAAVARGLYQAAQSTQNLADSVDKADAVFGSSKGLEQYANGAADNLGLSKAAALDAASAYGLLLKQSGLGGNALAQASAALATRTADLAERYKKPYEEVQKAIESVIRTGNNRSLKGLLGIGVQIDPKALQGLSTAARTQKVYNEVLSQTAGAQDTVKNSTDDLGVRLDIAAAKWEDAKASFGEAALPGLTRLADIGSKILDVFDELPGPAKELGGSLAVIGTVTAVAGGGISTLLGGVLKLGGPLRNIKKASDEWGGGLAGLANVANERLNPAMLATGGAVALVATALGTIARDSSNAEQRLRDVAKAGADLASSLATSNAPYTDAGNVIAKALRDVDAGDVLTRLGLNAESSGKLAINASRDWTKFSTDFQKSIELVDPDLLSQIFQPTGVEGGFVVEGADQIRASLDKIPKSIRPVVEGLLDLYDNGKINGDQFRAIVESFGAASASAKVAGQDFTKFAGALKDDVAPGALAAKGALADLDVLGNKNASFEDRLASAQKLAKLFPDVADKAGILAFALRDTGDGADDAAKGLGNLADAVERIKSGELTISQYASGLNATLSAVNKVTDAQKRLTDAQEKYAELTDPAKRQEKIADALDRVTSAEDTLTDAIDRRRKTQEELDALMKKSAVAGSVPLVQDIAKAAQQAVDDAQKSLDRIGNDYGVGSDQYIAAQKVLEAAKGRAGDAGGLLNQALAEQGAKNQQKINDLLKEQERNEKSITKARGDVGKAQNDYADALKGVDPKDITAALDAIDQAAAAFNIAKLEFKGGIEDGTISIEGLASYLDELVKEGLIDPASAERIKTSMDNASDGADTLAEKLGIVLPKAIDELVAKITSIAKREGIPAYQAPGGGGNTGLNSVTSGLVIKTIDAATGALGIQGSGITKAAGLKRGLGDDPLEYNGQSTAAKDGSLWKWVPGSQRWLPSRATGGPVSAGQTYMVNEQGQEFFTPQTSGYMVNAAKTKQMTSAAGSPSGAVFNNNFEIKSTEPRKTAEEVIRKQRAHAFRQGLV